jgi:hypothetical protein
MKWEIEITEELFVKSATVGMMRRIKAILKGRQRENGRVDFGFDADVQGAVMEGCFARLLQLPWRAAIGYLDSHLGDVAEYQIKSVRNRNHRLAVQEKDLEKFNFILGFLDLGDPPEYPPFARFLGWAPGSIVKVQSNWVPANGNWHKAAYQCPHKDLRPMDTLPLPTPKPTKVPA